MYARASVLTASDASAGSADRNFMSTIRLLRTGAILRFSRNVSMAFDSASVSSAAGASAVAAGRAPNMPRTHCVAPATSVRTSSFFCAGAAPNSSRSRSFRSWITRRASVRLWRMLYWVW